MSTSLISSLGHPSAYAVAHERNSHGVQMEIQEHVILNCAM